MEDSRKCVLGKQCLRFLLTFQQASEKDLGRSSFMLNPSFPERIIKINGGNNIVAIMKRLDAGDHTTHK